MQMATRRLTLVFECLILAVYWQNTISLFMYRISSHSFQGIYSLLNLEIQRSQYIRPTIQGRKLYEDIRYVDFLPWTLWFRILSSETWQSILPYHRASHLVRRDQLWYQGRGKLEASNPGATCTVYASWLVCNMVGGLTIRLALNLFK